jgi:hypothetical protein
MAGNTINGGHENLRQNSGAEKEEKQLNEVEKSAQMDVPRLLINNR